MCMCANAGARVRTSVCVCVFLHVRDVQACGRAGLERMGELVSWLLGRMDDWLIVWCVLLVCWRVHVQ